MALQKFTYKGESAEGEPVEVTVEAEDRFAVYDIARTNGHVVTNVSNAKTLFGGMHFDMSKINLLLSRVSAAQLTLATRNLSSMLTAGLPLTRALAVIERQSRNPRMKSVMTDISANISKGKQFHETLAAHPRIFSDLYVGMVRAGEEGGQLPEALMVLSEQLERSVSLKKKIKGAMIYPTIVIAVMVIIGILMLIYVVPQITATFIKLNIELPVTTRILIGTSTFVNENAFITIATMILVVVGFLYALRTRYGKRIFHYVIVRLPVIGTIVKEVNSARTARTLSSLLKSGVDIVSALKITEDVVQNVYYKDILKEAQSRVEKGSPFSEILNERTDLYPVLVGEMVAVGEETGQISDMLQEIAIFYETEVDQKTKDLSTIIEPLLMVVIGTGVGFFALAMIGPIYSISEGIG